MHARLVQAQAVVAQLLRGGAQALVHKTPGSVRLRKESKSI